MQLDKKSKKIVVLCPYPPNIAPGQRFRFELFFPHLNLNPLKLSFLNQNTHKILYEKGRVFSKLFGVLAGFIRRIGHLFYVMKYDYVFLFREASPIGPPIFEWIIAKVLKKKIIYDFDDAIWIPNTSKENSIVGQIKYHRKVASICKWSYKVSVGNEYLAAYAKKYNDSVFVIPTIVDTEKKHNRIKQISNKKITVGWTGSHSTLRYLSTIVPILQKLEKRFNFNTLIIADKNPDLELKNYQFIKWKEDTEIEDLSRIDIGLMPLTVDEWSLGKCGFKAIQYMALGIPALVSPVGVNTKIVDHGQNGFICSSLEDWQKNLELLFNNIEIRKKMGASAREKIVQDYSLKAIAPRFFELFE